MKKKIFLILVLVLLLGCSLYYFLRSNKKENKEVKKESKVLVVYYSSQDILIIQPKKLHPGDVVTIPANVRHWHGATSNSWFSHLAIKVPGENTSTEWCKPVTDEEYNNLL